MVTLTITNTSGAEITTGTSTALPPPFDWVTIADTANKAMVCTVQDLYKVVNATTGFTSADLLQQLVQAGKITVSTANVGATERDVHGKVVASET